MGVIFSLEKFYFCISSSHRNTEVWVRFRTSWTITVDPFLVFLSIKGVEKYMYWIASRKIKSLKTSALRLPCRLTCLFPKTSLLSSWPHTASSLSGTMCELWRWLSAVGQHPNFCKPYKAPGSAPALPVTGHHGTPLQPHWKSFGISIRIWTKSSLTQPFILRMCWCQYWRSLRTYSETYLVNQLYIPFSK